MYIYICIYVLVLFEQNRKTMLFIGISALGYLIRYKTANDLNAIM